MTANMAYEYGKMLDSARAILESRVTTGSRRLLQEARAKEALQGFIGRSTGQAQQLGRALIASHAEVTKQFIMELDRLLATGGDDVPVNAVEIVTAMFAGVPAYLESVLLSTVREYLGDFDGMNHAVKARLLAQWNEIRIELDQEFGLMVRKHRIAKPKAESAVPPAGVLAPLQGLSTQVNPVHFEDFSGKQFERLLLGYAIRNGWKDAEWLGEAGGDGGRDIWCEESRTAILCANLKQPTLAKARSDIEKLRAGDLKVKTVLVVFGGTVSADLRGKIKEAAMELGITNCLVWGHGELEENIRHKAPSLLQRFCGGVAFPETLEEMRELAVTGRPAKSAVTPKVQSASFNADQMSDDAKRLLFEMTEATDGIVLRSETHDGYSLTIDSRDFVPDTRERRVKARWERAIRELLADGLIEPEGPSGDIFAVTDAGYQAIDDCGLIPP